MSRPKRVIAALAATAMVSTALTAGAAWATSAVHISGQVVRDDGSPVANVVVRFGEQSTRTTADGSYFFAAWPQSGTARFEVESPLRAPHPTGVPDSFELRWPSVTMTQDTVIDVALPPAVEQTFVVHNSDGERVPGVVSAQQPRVLDVADGGGSGSGLAAPVVSQQISPVESGESTLVFADQRLLGLQVSGHPGISDELSDSVLTQDVDSLTVGHGSDAIATLPPTGDLALSISSSTGESVPDVAVFLKSKHGITQGRTDHDGVFRATAELGRWPVKLIAQAAEGTRPAWNAEVTRTVFDQSRWEYRLPDTHILTMRVHHADGTAAPGARVTSSPDFVAGQETGQLDLQQTMTGLADADGVARIPAFTDFEGANGLPSFKAEAWALGGASRWRLDRRFTVDTLDGPTRVEFARTTVLHGPVSWPDSGFTLSNLASAGRGVVGDARARDGYYRLTAASDGAELSLPRPGPNTRVPAQFQITVPFSSPQERVRSALTPPEVHRAMISLVQRDGDVAHGRYTVAAPQWERADKSRVFSGLPDATIRQALQSEQVGPGRQVMRFFADHDVERLKIYRMDADGRWRSVAVVDHLRLTRDTHLTLVVGTANRPETVR
jgi:hypothetical protein